MKKLNLFLGLLVCLFLTQDLFADPNGRRVDVSTLTAAQRLTLANAMLGYIDLAVIEEHGCNSEYGNFNGVAGSIHGPEMFLNWHRQYLEEMESAISGTLAGMGLSLLPRWDPAMGLGGVLDFLTVDPACPSSCGGGTCAAPNPATFPNGIPTAYPAILEPIMNCALWTDYEDFSEDLRTGYHVVGHVAAGNVMGNFKSPAAPLFWLWHGMIDDVYWDYQQACAPNSEIYMQDTPSDTGAEPNPDTGPMWISQDIWVRQSQDTRTGSMFHPHGSSNFANAGSHENPEFKTSGSNFIYVRLRNNTAEDFSGGRLRVYWSKASTGLNWPTTWINYFAGTTVLHGDELLPTGTGLVPDDSNFYIPPIEAGQQFIMEIPWTVPNPADFTNDIHHFCILARIVSDFDPMDTPEGTGIGANVRNNNNIVWKNVSVFDLDPFNIVDPGGSPSYVAKQVAFQGTYVTNATTTDQATNLTFEALRDRNVRYDFYDIGGTAFVRLDKDLGELWARVGYRGEGIRILGWYDEKLYVNLEGKTATILGLGLAANANHSIEMGFAMTKPGEPGQRFDYDVVQDDATGRVGGERFELNLQEGRGGSTDNASLAVESNNSLLITPNPTTGQFTLNYELAADQFTNFTIFDISGRKVRNLSSQRQEAGYYTTPVDVSDLSAGIYILRAQIGDQLITKKLIIE
ncbi:MAG: tyrosinase family protein [Bacteroidota bacterium]